MEENEFPSNVVDIAEFRDLKKLGQIGIDHDEYCTTALTNLYDKTYFDIGPFDPEQMLAYHETHLFLLAFEFNLDEPAFQDDIGGVHQVRGVKLAGVMTAYDLAIDKMMTDIKTCHEEENFPWGMQKEHFEDADLTPYCIAFLTKEHRQFDRRAPVGPGNFDALMLVPPALLAFFDRYIRKFGVTTFGNLLAYTKDSVTVTMKVAPYHRSFGSLAELVNDKVASMNPLDLAPILPDADPLMEIPSRLEFFTEFYGWQERMHGASEEHDGASL
ncbi:hypothetical protein IHQ71_31390 (plasmid) [Rhizobium sp. TH2]|uniref:hypothetical protein n=1 Tax=Rhizobium sp. TH2 TaxID=2775403 RepID=UPI002157B1BE|nr:hypothetical protein [Rhizobium sp. TH2]UVC12670.1 hypothetical protein IHQ71_31390 [Rhizobium sp. TH2]